MTRRLVSLALLLALGASAPLAVAAPKGAKSVGTKREKPRPAAKRGDAGKAAALAKVDAAKDKRGGKDANAARGAKGIVDEAARRGIAGGSAEEIAPPLPAEVLALKAIERELFPEMLQRDGGRVRLPSDAELGPLDLRPVILSSGLAPSSRVERDAPPTLGDEPRDGFLAGLEPSTLSSRWDPRVIRYLRFFHDDPRGKSMVLTGWRRSGKYGDAIKAAFRAEGVPEDLLWLALVESAFDPTVKSSAGAAGLFQFMPDGARQYGLRLDRWTDERRDPAKSATAAAKYLADLHKRFGTWELALAAYNMGHGALLQAVRKYSTNDFWELARLEAGLPWETTLYVPKILALATVAKNPAAFGLATVGKEPAVGAESVSARGGIPLELVASAAGATTEEILALNPHLRTERTPLAPRGPDGMGEFAVNVPKGRGAACFQRLPSLAAKEPAFVEHVVRLGQSVSSLAAELSVSRAKILAWNGLASGEAIKPGDVLVLPADGARKVSASIEKLVVVVPDGQQALPGKTRVFYRVARGDVLRTIATAFLVDESDLASWNVLDPLARLQDGMTLQVFVDRGHDLSRVVALREEEVQVLVVGSDEFFAYFEDKKGRRRVEIICSEKDTWQSLAARYKLSVALLERINRRARSTPLAKGDKIIVYTGLAEKVPAVPHDEAVTGKSVPVSPEAEATREAE